MREKSYLIYIPLVALIIFGVLYLSFLKIENRQTVGRHKKIAELFEKANFYHHSGNPGEAATYWNQIIATVDKNQDPGLYAAAVAGTAWDDFATCTVDGKLRAISIFKNYVAAETNAPPRTQANMIMSLLDIFNASHDANYLQAIFESGEPWQDFLKNAQGKGRLAERLAYEWVLGIYPNALAHYRISYWYGEQLLANGRLSDAERKDFSQKLAQHVRAGDELFRRDFGTLYLTPEVEVRTAELHLMRTVAHRFLLTAGQGTPEEVDGYFQRTARMIAHLEKKAGRDNLHFRDIPYEFAYHYASFLFGAYGASRASDIAEQAKTIARGALSTTPKGNPTVFSLLMANEYKIHHSHEMLLAHEPHYPDFHQLVEVAKMSSELQLALVKLGWSASLFAAK